MQFKKFNSKFILRLDWGEEIVSTLKNFCQDQNIKLGTISALGATNKAEIGLFDPETKKYSSQIFTGNYEIASLYGNISTMNGEIYLHLHINLGDQNHHSFSGHLSSAVVSATFEAVIEVIDGEMDRFFDEEIGLNLFKF